MSADLKNISCARPAGIRNPILAREPDEGVRRGPGGPPHTDCVPRFLGFVLTIFTNGGIGIRPKAPGSKLDPARDLTQMWRLTIYSIVKLRWPRATHAHKNGWPPAAVRQLGYAPVYDIQFSKISETLPPTPL